MSAAVVAIVGAVKVIAYCRSSVEKGLLLMLSITTTWLTSEMTGPSSPRQEKKELKYLLAGTGLFHHRLQIHSASTNRHELKQCTQRTYDNSFYRCIVAIFAVRTVFLIYFHEELSFSTFVFLQPCIHLV